MIEKSERLELRLSAKQKQQIKNLANKCGLSISEYVLQRALNFEPKTIMPDVFYDFYSKLCEIYNTSNLSEQTEDRLLELIDLIHAELLKRR